MRHGDVLEEIESLHLFEGEQRVLLVDDVITAKEYPNPGPNGLRVKEQTLWRYQYGNHLGSVGLELDRRRPRSFPMRSFIRTARAPIA